MIYPQQIRLGSLDCISIEPQSAEPDAAPPEALVVLCHGYGAPGTDMVGVVQEWIHLLGESAKRFSFLCPAAPLSLADLGLPSGRAWWALNMARMMEAVQAQRFEELHTETPPGLESARDQLTETINLAVEQLAQKLDRSNDEVPLAIGGFSQGAMLTMDTALRGKIPQPDLLVQFSGTVICQPEWEAAAESLRQTKVFQSHGTVDPILPFASAERLRDLLTAADVDLKFHDFYGPHSIDGVSIETTAMMLQQLLSGKNAA
ncbi:dienelactone hydrolase family protein [Stieleria sp. JC731]|uniref:alpha/beta hydrolase n=1 Tax=Pirellulaceae TaxID=2691357 RepID=UPI001E51CE74|nr:dienelactone hydrolase family protein [Stieleria sp. JC731]MCC9599194.1 dienelactone hydrolase family protein [Stieleria sp. JC731]